MIATSFKKTGIEWIPEVPEHWEIRRLSGLFEERNETVSENDYMPLSVTMKGIVPQLETAAKTMHIDNRKLVCVGDFAINSRSDRRGSGGISNFEGSVSIVNTVLKSSKFYISEFTHYLLTNKLFQDEYYSKGKGIVDDMWSTKYSDLKTIYLPVPTKEEQDQIVQYIKSQEEKINWFIEKKQRFIELLKEQRQSVINEAITKGVSKDIELKDSGVDWLGELPKTWEIRKLKWVSKSIQTGSTPKSENSDIHFEGGEINWFTPGDIKDLFITNSNRKITQKAIDDNVVTLFPAKSVLVIGIGGTLGKVSMIEVDGGSNQQINSVTFNDEVLPEFGLYYLSAFEAILKSISNAATLAILTQSDLKDMLFILPPIEEQKQIIEHIKTETAIIDITISKAEREIELIREYKESMIAEAVLGRRKG